MRGARSPIRFAGVALMVASVFVLTFSLATADYEAYIFDWSSQAYNNLASGGGHLPLARAGRIVSTTNNNSYSDWVCLGPAEWRVDGSMNGSTIEEQWSVSQWSDVPFRWDLDTFQNQYQYASVPWTGGCSTTGADGTLPTQGQQPIPWTVKPSGSYGANVTYAYRSDNFHKNQLQAMQSQPLGWTIKGCIYTTTAEQSQCEAYWQSH